MKHAEDVAFANETDQSVTMLLRIEVDFGMTMAQLALRSLTVGNTEESLRLTYHANSALASLTQHKHRAGGDAALEQHYCELRALVAVLDEKGKEP